MTAFTRAKKSRPITDKVPRTHRKRQGSALVATLVTVGIGTLVAGSVATLTLSSYSRTLAEQNNAKALDMAECAAQYQMQRILATMDRLPVPYNGLNVELATYGTKANPIRVTDKIFGGGSTTLNTSLGLNTARADGKGDYAIAWIEYPDSPTRAFTLDAQDDVYVYGEARVGNVWRRVRATAGSGCAFDHWGCYGHTCIAMSGTLTCTPTTGTNKGCIASNQQISVKPGSTCGQQTVFGNCTPEPTIPYTWGGNSCEVSSHNTCAHSAHTCGGYAVSPTYTSALNSSVSAGTQSPCASKKFCGTVTNSSCNDNYTCGRVYSGYGSTVAMSGTGNQGALSGSTCYLRGKGIDGSGNIVRDSAGNQACANFYMKSVQGSNRAIYCDVSKGPVNLWIDSDDSDGDLISNGCDIAAYESTDWFGNPICTQSAARKFHIFYNNSNDQPLKFNCASGSTRRVCGMVHSFNKDDDGTTCRGKVQVDGAGLSVIGAVVANKVQGAGNLSINYAPRGASEDTSGSYFERRGGFQEVLPSRGN